MQENIKSILLILDFSSGVSKANLSADRILTKGQYIKAANWVISQRLSFYLPTDEITS